MSPNQTCAEALVRLLERRGVNTVFGIPGVHTLELYRGLSNSTIRHILVRHEQGAGFMADGYARISGRPGVCFVITGPGVTNITTPMAQAYSDSVPMLVISTVRRTDDLGSQLGRLHEISDQRSVTAPLCAFAATAMTPKDVPLLIDKAFAVFEGARPRPVHIEIPLDVAEMVVEGEWLPADPVFAPEPDTAAITMATNLLGDARMPVIVVGGGACDAGPELSRLAEQLGAPVITTVAAKGLMVDDHPLHLGCTLSSAETQKFLAESDVVLAIGTELAETDSWCRRLSLPGALIRIDIDPGQINNPYPATLGITSDATTALEALLSRLPTGRFVDFDSIQKRVRDMRRSAVKDQSAAMRSHRSVLKALRSVLPETAVIYTDMTQIAYSGNEVYAAPRPRSWFHPSGFGTLGYAMPAAIGGKLASPATPVVALVGDAGLQFTVQELAVATELDLHLIVILWNNDALGQIRDDMIENGIGKIGVEQRNPDFDLLARAYGAYHRQPEGLDELTNDLSKALHDPGVWLIEVRESAFS